MDRDEGVNSYLDGMNQNFAFCNLYRKFAVFDKFVKKFQSSRGFFFTFLALSLKIYELK